MAYYLLFDMKGNKMFTDSETCKVMVPFAKKWDPSIVEMYEWLAQEQPLGSVKEGGLTTAVCVPNAKYELWAYGEVTEQNMLTIPEEQLEDTRMFLDGLDGIR